MGSEQKVIFRFLTSHSFGETLHEAGVSNLSRSSDQEAHAGPVWTIKKCKSLVTISSDGKKIKGTAILLPRLLLKFQREIHDPQHLCAPKYNPNKNTVIPASLWVLFLTFETTVCLRKTNWRAQTRIKISRNGNVKKEHPVKPHQDKINRSPWRTFIHAGLTGKRRCRKGWSVNNSSRWPTGVGQEVNKTAFPTWRGVWNQAFSRKYSGPWEAGSCAQLCPQQVHRSSLTHADQEQHLP